MDFDLSSICDMLGDRIEEYKSTAKKRRIERERCAAKARIAKITHEHQTSVNIQKGLRMYASTPNEMQTTETSQWPTVPATFSSITKLPTPSTAVKRFTRNLNINARKLTYDDEEDSADLDENSKMEESPASISSIAKIHSLGTLKRRRLQREKMSGRRLFIDEDDENNEESSENSAKISFDNVESKDVDFLRKDSVSDTNNQVLTPLYTPKRHHLSKRSMNVRKINFDDSENENDGMVKSSLNDSPSEEKLSNIKSSPEILKRINFKDQDLLESSSNCVETTLTPDEPMEYSTLMVLNMGISIRSLRDVCEEKM